MASPKSSFEIEKSSPYMLGEKGGDYERGLEERSNTKKPPRVKRFPKLRLICFAFTLIRLRCHEHKKNQYCKIDPA
jgi:hypothetical protein